VSGLVEWALFLALSMVAVVTAAGMLLTMSMYRAGLALMSCFVALAGLFLLLDADLLAAIQVMMNVGGMVVMMLFMVMLMMDPGGEMMWDMKRKMHLPGPGAFSMSMPRGAPPVAAAPPGERETRAPAATDWTCPMHREVSAPGPGACPICGMALIPRAETEASNPPSGQPHSYTCPMHSEVRQDHPGTCPKCGMELVPVGEADEQTHSDDDHQAMPMSEARGDQHGGMPLGQLGSDRHGGMAGMSPRQHYQMMVDMAMSTAQLPWALALGVASAAASCCWSSERPGRCRPWARPRTPPWRSASCCYPGT
jgi:hypothetical protein